MKRKGVPEALGPLGLDLSNVSVTFYDAKTGEAVMTWDDVSIESPVAEPVMDFFDNMTTSFKIVQTADGYEVIEELEGFRPMSSDKLAEFYGVE